MVWIGHPAIVNLVRCNLYTPAVKGDAHCWIFAEELSYLRYLCCSLPFTVTREDADELLAIMICCFCFRTGSRITCNLSIKSVSCEILIDYD